MSLYWLRSTLKDTVSNLKHAMSERKKIPIYKQKIKSLQKRIEIQKKKDAVFLAKQMAKQRDEQREWQAKLKASKAARLKEVQTSIAAERKSWSKTKPNEIHIGHQWCPIKGYAVIAYKEVRYAINDRGNYGRAVLKLLIPADADRFQLKNMVSNAKCRASKAKVLAVVWSEDGNLKRRRFISLAEQNFVYEVGQTVKPKLPFSKKKEQCESGIHFYLHYEGARNH